MLKLIYEDIFTNTPEQIQELLKEVYNENYTIEEIKAFLKEYDDNKPIIKKCLQL